MSKITAIILVAAFTTAFAGLVPVVTVDGAINPVSSKYILRNLEKAERENAPCMIIVLDTPGGLMSSTEDLTRALLAAEIPVIIYVHPKGARAASAGVFIAYAAHIVAMTPGTRIGAAHPVDMMGGGASDSASATMMEKVANDAVANVKSMAIERGRNPDWPEQAIRESKSITADEALELGVIDLIAEDIDGLIEALDGFAYGSDDLDTLRLPKPTPDRRPMTSVEEFLFTILNPNIAYMLLMLGIVGIYLELQNPGGILPGVVGGIAILLALYAFQILPVNYAGVALIILAVVLFILETQTPTFGLLTAGGVIAMLSGSFLLTSGNPALFTVKWTVILPTVILAALIVIFALYKAVKARIAKPFSGKEGLIGEKGIVAKPAREDLRNTLVEIHGEIWAAEGIGLKPGDKVIVEDVEGNKLIVRRA